VFEDNICSGNTEPADHDGSNVELRGYANIVRNNQISDSAGVTMKIASDGGKYDNGGNIVENNRMSGSVAALLLDSRAAQGPMCGNIVTTAAVLDDDDDTAAADITAPCRP
jgi:hypothetical protein